MDDYEKYLRARTGTRNSQEILRDHTRSYEYRLKSYSCSDILYTNVVLLIPSCTNHLDHSNLLVKELQRQGGLVLTDCRDDIDLGSKRESLYKKAFNQACYAIQVDADDWVTADFVKSINDAAKSDADVINFVEYVDVDNKPHEITLRSLVFPWNGARMPNRYCFSPNTKSVIKVDLTTKVPFEKGCKGEDLAFGRDIRPYLQTEFNIGRVLYYYEYNTDTSQTHTNERLLNG